MKMDLDQLRKLIQLLEESTLTEIEIEQDDDRIRLRREPPSILATAPAEAAPHFAPGAQATALENTPPALEGTYVTSPFVGTFYRSPSPDAVAFVEVGDLIQPGQVLCIVEAMKLMNEIEAEIEGRIVEVLVESGKPVEYGDRLFRIETS